MHVPLVVLYTVIDFSPRAGAAYFIGIGKNCSGTTKGRVDIRQVIINHLFTYARQLLDVTVQSTSRP